MPFVLEPGEPHIATTLVEPFHKPGGFVDAYKVVGGAVECPDGKAINCTDLGRIIAATAEGYNGREGGGWATAVCQVP